MGRKPRGAGAQLGNGGLSPCQHRTPLAPPFLAPFGPFSPRPEGAFRRQPRGASRPSSTSRKIPHVVPPVTGTTTSSEFLHGRAKRPGAHRGASRPDEWRPARRRWRAVTPGLAVQVNAVPGTAASPERHIFCDGGRSPKSRASAGGGVISRGQATGSYAAGADKVSGLPLAGRPHEQSLLLVHHPHPHLVLPQDPQLLQLRGDELQGFEQIEGGEIAEPRVSTLRKLATALGIEARDLLED